MKPLRTLLAACIAAFLVLACATSASATTPYQQGAYINDYPVYVYANGKGQFNTQAYFTNVNYYSGYSSFYFPTPGQVTDGNADNGLNVAVYDADGLGHTQVFGFEGTPFVPTNPVAPVAKGTNATTQTLTSVFTTGDCSVVVHCLQITETLSYTTGQQTGLVGYDIKNVSANQEPVNFRVTMGGDVKPGGNEGGQGAYDDTSAPRVMGTINQRYGAGMEIQESTGTNVVGGTPSPTWSKYQEGVPFQIWRQVKTPDTGTLANTVQDAYSDKAAAVQWDTFKTTTLPYNNATGSAYFEARWKFFAWTPLQIPSPAPVATHTPVTMDVVGHDPPSGTTLTDFSAHPLYWYVPNPYANPHSTPTQATPTAPGHAAVSYTGTKAGSDYVYMFEDLNGNQTADLNEPADYQFVDWFDRLSLYSFSDNFPYVGSTETATVRIYDLNKLGMSGKQFDYRVVDKANPNRVIVPLTSGTTLADGSFQINWSRYDEGTDVLQICANLSATGAYNDCSDPGETANYELTWYPRIDVYPTSSQATVGNTVNFDLYAYDTGGAKMPAGTQIHYWVTDGQGQLVGPADNVTTGIDSTAYTSLSYSSASVGERNLHFYLDEGAPLNQHNGNEPQTDAVIDFVSSGTNRLQVDDNQLNYNNVLVPNSYGTAGGSARTLHFTLYDVDGVTPMPNKTIRYRIYGTACPGSGYQALVTGTSGGNIGKASLDLSCASAGYQYVDAYADLNGDGDQDGNEPDVYGPSSITWVPAINISPYDAHVPGTAFASVSFRDTQGRLIPNEAYYWKTDGEHVSSYQGSPLTAVNGTAFIEWPATDEATPGTDTLYVKADVGSGLQEVTKTVKFLPQLDLDVYDSSLSVGDHAFVSPSLYSQSNTGKVFHYSITGANPTTPGDHTVTYPTDISWTGNAPGDDVLHVWFDSNANNTEDAGDLSNDTTIHWTGALVLTNTADAIAGSTKTVTATLYDTTSGLPVGAGQTIRWSISGSNNPGGKLAGLTDGSGQVQIQWDGTNAECDGLTVYADTNTNGVHDSGEPLQDTYICFHAQLEGDQGSYDFLYQGATETVTLTYRDLNFQPKPNYTYNSISHVGLKYVIVGYNGDPAANGVATPQPLSTDANGRAIVSWVGTEAGLGKPWGTDVLKVWDDVNGNDLIDGGEQTSTTRVEWESRVQFTNVSSPMTRNVTAGPLDVSVHLYKPDGGSLNNTTITYKIEGLNATSSNQTVTSGPTGIATIHLSTTDAGQDTLTAWIDGDTNGARDTGEPEQQLVLNWHAAVGASPSYTHLYQTQTFPTPIVVTASPNPSSPVANNLHVTITGANPRTEQTYSYTTTPVTITPDPVGGRPGRDYIHIWLDANKNGTHDVDETTTAVIDWDPLVVIGYPSGTLNAGTSTTVPAQLINTSGNGAQASHFKFKVTGANTVAPTAVTTDATGHASGIGYTSAEPGSDYLTVWEDLNDDNVVDSGEPQNERTIGWSAPPVALGIAPPGDEKLQGGSESAVVTLTGLPGGNSGKTVYWSVSGVNSGAGSATTDGAGQATVGPWTGTLKGIDHLNVYADVSGAPAVRDSFDPAATLFMTWDAIVALDETPAYDAVGATHSEAFTFTGYPDTQVIYSITGVNPTAGQVVSRAVAAGSGSRLLARTNSSGAATISWVGTNAGTDTLDVWADANNNGVVDGAESTLHNSKPVTFCNPGVSGCSAVAPTGTTTTSTTDTTPTATGAAGPVAYPAQVTPGSPQDLDGLAAPPPPVVARKVNIAPISGKVLVKLPGKKGFIELIDAEQIPVGSIVDVTNGRVALTAAQNLKGGIATAEFYLGIFQIGQQTGGVPITDLTLYGGSFKSCAKISRKSANGAAKKKIRQLWGSGTGLFRTKGKYASATVRGTTWQTVDYCDGTLVKVTKGAVTVFDQVKKKSVPVKAPKSYFAAAKAKAGRKRG